MDEMKKRMAESVVRGVCKSSPSSSPDMIFLSVRSNSMLSELSDDELRQIVNDVYAKVKQNAPKQDTQKQDELAEKAKKEAEDYLRAKEEQKRNEERKRQEEAERLAELERKREEENKRREQDAIDADKEFDKSGSLDDVRDFLKEKGYKPEVIELLLQEVKKGRTVIGLGERKNVFEALEKRYNKGEFNELPKLNDWYDYVKDNRIGGKKRTKRDLMPLLEILYERLQQKKKKDAEDAKQKEEFERRQKEKAEQRERERQEREEQEAAADNVDLNEETNADNVEDVDVADVAPPDVADDIAEDLQPDVYEWTPPQSKEERDKRFQDALNSYYGKIIDYVDANGARRDDLNYFSDAYNAFFEGGNTSVGGEYISKETALHRLLGFTGKGRSRKYDAFNEASELLNLSAHFDAEDLKDAEKPAPEPEPEPEQELEPESEPEVDEEAEREAEEAARKAEEERERIEQARRDKLEKYIKGEAWRGAKANRKSLKFILAKRRQLKAFKNFLKGYRKLDDAHYLISKGEATAEDFGFSSQTEFDRAYGENWRQFGVEEAKNRAFEEGYFPATDEEFNKNVRNKREEIWSAAPPPIQESVTNTPPPPPINTGLRPLNLSNVLPDTSLDTPRGSTGDAEANRAATQGLAETIIAQRPFANDWYIKQKASSLGVGNNLSWQHWLNPFRNELYKLTGTGYYSKDVNALANGGYVLDDFLKMSPEERMRNRSTLENLGLVGKIEDSGAVSGLTQANYFSKFNQRKREEAKELRRIEKEIENGDDSQIERRDILRSRQADYKSGIDPDKKRVATERDIDTEFVGKAKEYFDAIKKVFNFSTGQISNGGINALPEEIQKFLEKIRKESPNPEAYIYNSNESRGERERRERRRRESTGFDFLDQMFARGAKWTRKGQTLGGILDRFGGGGGGGGGPFGAGLGKLLGAIGLVVGAISGLVGIGKRLYAAAQKSIQVTWELVSYNGRLGATKAQYEGQEFSRKQIFAADTEDSRVELVNAQNDLLNSTTKLRAEFAKAGLWIQTKFLRALQWVADKLGLTDAEDYSERDEVDIVKDKLDANSENQRATESEISAQGKLARRYFEYGEFDSELAKQAGFEDPEEARLRLNDKGYRNFWEDAIAFNDVRNGKDFYQGYKGFGVTDTAFTSTSQIQEQILSALENGNMSRLEQLKKAEEILKADLEIARNTAKDSNINSQPIFKAMEKVANLYAVKGGEKIAGDGYSHTWGAKQEKRYGRFASASQTNWGGRNSEEE